MVFLRLPLGPVFKNPNTATHTWIWLCVHMYGVQCPNKIGRGGLVSPWRWHVWRKHLIKWADCFFRADRRAPAQANIVASDVSKEKNPWMEKMNFLQMCGFVLGGVSPNWTSGHSSAFLWIQLFQPVHWYKRKRPKQSSVEPMNQKAEVRRVKSPNWRKSEPAES
jgi:hypothetical protein